MGVFIRKSLRQLSACIRFHRQDKARVERIANIDETESSMQQKYTTHEIDPSSYGATSAHHSSGVEPKLLKEVKPSNPRSNELSTTKIHPRCISDVAIVQSLAEVDEIMKKARYRQPNAQDLAAALPPFSPCDTELEIGGTVLGGKNGVKTGERVDLKGMPPKRDREIGLRCRRSRRGAINSPYYHHRRHSDGVETDELRALLELDGRCIEEPLHQHAAMNAATPSPETYSQWVNRRNSNSMYSVGETSKELDGTVALLKY